MTKTLELGQYIPKKLALNTPPGESIFEFAIYAQDRVGVLEDLVRVFSQHRVDIKSVSAEQVSSSSKGFVASLFCDLSFSGCLVEKLEWDLRHLDGVISVRSASTKGKLWGEFSFPIKLSNEKRVVILRVEPMLQIERNLIRKMGSAGASMMFNEGEVYAEEVLREYRKIFPNASKDQMLQVLQAEMRATGCGILDISIAKDGFEVALLDPPISKEADYTENRFMYGVVARMLELIFLCKLRLTSSSFDRSSRVLSFRLVIVKREEEKRAPDPETDTLHIAYQSEV